EDDKGLLVDSALEEELAYVRDLEANLRNGNITGMSFGFYVIKDEWNSETLGGEGADAVEVDVRGIREVRLVDVSAVSVAAEPEAELKAVARALDRRGDYAAVEAAARHRPELLDLVHIDREPGESTRGTQEPAEPAVSTQPTGLPISMRMNALAARYGLKR